MVGAAALVFAWQVGLILSQERNNPHPEFAVKVIHVSGQKLDVLIADTKPKLAQGLGGMAGLATYDGMLFVFDHDGRHPFWMRSMRFSVDILWISAEKRIVYLEKSVSPDTFPQSFTPPTPARYVLEVPAGFSERHGIAEGKTIEF
jgi:hypothetical protein